MTQDAVWRELYRGAILELNPTKLQERIEAARAAIRRRMERLPRSHNDGTGEERQAMTDALENLQTLQRVELGSLTKPAAASDESPDGGAL